jgi:cell division septum initiation protein DivIVA
MKFCFYPQHQYGCPHVGRCPHLGGAALGTLVHAASDHDQYLRTILGQLDFERDRNAKLFEENEQLKKQVEQLKLELKVERQSKYATSASEDEPPCQPPATPDADSTVNDQPKKRGAPVGHPGWFRPSPTAYDALIHVDAPGRCSHCGGLVHLFPAVAPYDHLQEDVVDGVYRVVCYRHPAARCDECRDWVQQAGDGEILGSRVGPRLRSWAVYLRNGIGISYRKVPKVLEELLDVTFTPAALLGFERMLAIAAQPLADDIAKKIGSSDDAVHADETYWTLNGRRAFYWLHGTEKFIHFQFDTSRAGEVSRNVLGPYFDGTLVTDCYAGYEAHQAKAKQKCLAHLARTARDWQKVVPAESAAQAFFADVKAWVRRGCRFYHQRRRGELSPPQLAQQETWLREELLRLQACPLDHEKALTLQGRICKHADEWLVFVDDPRVPPTNNLAERALRPLVVLRKITFGHRSEAGARRMATIMTVQETSKRHGRKPTDIFYGLYTRPPNRVLRYLYAGRSRSSSS